MRDEQENLANNFDAFITNFADMGVDFKMGITTTDTEGNNAGKPVPGSLTKLTSAKLNENRSQFLQDFSDLVKVGIRGSGREKGIQASESFASLYASEHFREDAYFVVIYMSDEEDQSSNSPEQHLSGINNWKQNSGLIKTYSIVDTQSNPNWSGNGMQYGHARYKKMSDLTGGFIADINNNFYTTLLNIGDGIVQLTQSFPLSQVPYDAQTIKVFVDGIQNSNWIYDAQSRTIKFNDGQEPAVNSIIKVTYEVEA